MHVSTAIACLFLTLGADGQKMAQPGSSFGHDGGSKLYREAYDQAKREADVAIKTGRAAIFVFGLRRSADLIDKETGLPFEPIAGCMVDDGVLGRAAGNNDRIRESIAKNGPPANSLKKWEKELFDLKGYVAACEKAAAPDRLVLGGAGSKSPDGKFTVRAVPSGVKVAEGSRIDPLGIVVTSGGVDLPKVEFFRPSGGPVEVVWGPEGSGFFVLASKAGGIAIHRAYDDRTGRMLRGEYSDPS
jgi:hypothetical protein